LDGEEAAHKWVDAAVIGIGTRWEWRKGIAGIGSEKPGIKGAPISQATIIGNDGVGLLGTISPREGCSQRNRQLIGRKKWGLRIDEYVKGGSGLKLRESSRNDQSAANEDTYCDPDFERPHGLILT